MKISSIKLLQPRGGLQPFSISYLGDIVIVSGSNGAGKTRLIKLIERYVAELRDKKDEGYLEVTISGEGKEEILNIDNVASIEIENYSHFDAQLQLPGHFTPYVIHKAKNVLQTCNYEETALNSLLLLEDMAKGYSEEFKDGDELKKFADNIAASFHIEVKQDDDTKKLMLFNLGAEKAKLSPGQQYLLRIAVACYRNLDNDKMIFLLDEPELHLHPQALIELVNNLRDKFKKAQFWISTHSMALISYLTVVNGDTTVLYLDKGKTDIFRSNSEKLLDGLIGSKENLFAIQQLMIMPDEYACNKFAAQCFSPPGTLGASGNDPQVELIKTIFNENDVVVDYGAGRGRFYEELALAAGDDIAQKIQYYAYDPSEKDAEQCKNVMNRYGSMSEHYYNDANEMLKSLQFKVNYVLLVNVLHEIDPNQWIDVFKQIYRLLKKEGKLIVVEREELTIGEAPYDNGFLMMTENGAGELFGKENHEYYSHPQKKYIVKYAIKKQGLLVTPEKVSASVKKIKEDALSEIRDLKHDAEGIDDLERYKKGIKLAFLLHQYANASLIFEEIKNM